MTPATPIDDRIDLPSNCDAAMAIEQAAALRMALATARRDHPLTVDITAGRPTAFATQLLIATAKTPHAAGSAVRFGDNARRILLQANFSEDEDVRNNPIRG
ncbi:hypothetical protein [Tabrizicola sp. M-4]|uniref:hypothetical protein n=1 Tax=Tabrizicola sp. M-4 TaxID=3055847 RepID=UPI003DA7CEAB